MSFYEGFQHLRHLAAERKLVVGDDLSAETLETEEPEERGGKQGRAGPAAYLVMDTVLAGLAASKWAGRTPCAFFISMWAPWRSSSSTTLAQTFRPPKKKSATHN